MATVKPKRVPWNKGLKHSEETKAKIRATTREAMKRPDIIAKLTISGHKQRHTAETKAKISAKVSLHRYGLVSSSEPAPEAAKLWFHLSELNNQEMVFPTPLHLPAAQYAAVRFVYGVARLAPDGACAAC